MRVLICLIIIFFYGLIIILLYFFSGGGGGEEGLFLEGLVIGGNFALQNELGLTIRNGFVYFFLYCCRFEVTRLPCIQEIRGSNHHGRTIFSHSMFRVPKGFRVPGLWPKICGAPGLQDKNIRAPGLQASL